MRLTREEAEERGIDLKGWTGALQRAGRAPEAPSFQMAGPCMLDVRVRRAPRPGGPASATVRYPFIGDEKFKISGIDVTLHPNDMSYIIKMMFTPATLELSQEMTGLTLLMQEAFSTFDGLEEWAMGFRGEVFTKSVPVTPKKALEVEHDSNEAWGSW